MRLMLLRHAKAEKAEGAMRDRDRRLNERGRSDASLIGAYLAHHELVPDLAVVSAAQRTRESWECAAAALPAPVMPMLATAGKVPTGPGWAFEFKWDGVRAVVAAAGDQV